MHIRDIGIGAEPPGFNSRLSALEKMLDDYAGFGFRLVELDPAWFGVIIAGELRTPQVERIVGVLRNFDLRYSVHGLERLNLAYDPRHELCRAIMLAQIEFCRRVGAHTLVYHSGLQALGDVGRGVRLSLLTDEELAEGAAREVAAFKDIAPVAADAGVTIGMENGDPHLWEYTVLDKFNRPRAELVKHHPRLRVGPMVRQLEAIDHPNVGMTLDIAHLHLAAREIGFDYLDAVSEAAPWVRHLHVNDNFGILDRGIDSEIDRWAFGEADVHLPPGWGRIPYPDVFARLPDYQGDLILEIKAGFYDHLPEVLADMRERLAGSGAKGGETSQSR
jgi:sugar phosphate isomerase/epimerase